MNRLPEDEIRHLPPQRQEDYRRLVATAECEPPARVAHAEAAVEQFIADTEETRAARRLEAEDTAEREQAGIRERLREIDAEREAIKAKIKALRR